MRSIRSSILARRSISNILLRKACPAADGPLFGRADDRGPAMDLRLDGRGDPGRQPTRNRRAPTGGRVDVDVPAMQLDQALDQGEPEAGARLARLRVAALEHFEDAV